MPDWNDFLSTHSRIGQSPITDSENGNSLQALNDTWTSSRLPLSHPQHSLISQHQITGDIHHHVSQLREEIQLETRQSMHTTLTLHPQTLHPNNSDIPEISRKTWMSSWFLEELNCDYFPTLEERKIMNVIKNNRALNSLFFVNSTQPTFLYKIT